ncbi:tyrosine-type recombinase/integrase [Haloparvum sp. PAK95]|uniref:tyrosine-type recombinase/integrase n=1 Tax=Haloparvum sp. PAK95 TaxID=3418962 RepID=UPI003D2F2156
MDERIAEFESNHRTKTPEETVWEYYLDLRWSELEKSSRKNIRAAGRKLDEYLKENNLSFSDLNANLVSNYISYLEDHPEIEFDSTIEGHVSRLATMVDWFNNKGLMAGNPFRTALEKHDFETTPNSRTEVPIDELRTAISKIRDPPTLAVVVVLLKTGLRISELANLDERDLHLNHPIRSILDEPRSDLVGKPDSIFIDSSISAGDEVNGEVRVNSNKPKSTRIVPLDSEAKEVLVWYLAMRAIPDSEANPVFTITSVSRNTPIGSRPECGYLRGRFNDWSGENGWYNPEDPGSVKPHWCRHWFSTAVRSNVKRDKIEIGNEDDYIDYLRGDSASETRDDYIQMSWGSNHWMHEALEDALPNLLTDSEGK